MAAHVFVLVALTAAVTVLVIQNRALTVRLATVENALGGNRKDPLRPGSAGERESRSAGREYGAGNFAEGPDGRPARRADSDPTAPSGTPSEPEAKMSESAALTPAFEEAVARAVDRILKEKYGHLPKIPNPEDLEKVLEKELNLTASQKVRIAELLKQKRAELGKLFTEDEGGLSGSALKKGMEIERRYEAAIKNELDSAQQAKYEQLKKDGKIPQGVVVTVDAEAPADRK
jgi:hypothetical protein